MNGDAKFSDRAREVVREVTTARRKRRGFRVKMLIDWMLAADVTRGSALSLDEFTERANGLEFGSSIDRAAGAGVLADRLGYAFAGGYRAALGRLVPGIAGNAALCATEEGGAHPRFIRTMLEPDGDAWRLHGTKAWVTLGTAAEELLVVASVGADDNGRNRLKVARVPATRAGITLVARAATPFAPEIPHAEARFDGVKVDASDVLVGDGYDAYLKPFRTIEDVHVLAAAVGYLVGVARVSRWPRSWIEQALVVLLGLREIGAADPAARATHIALAGAFALTRRLVADAEPHWANVDVEERARWQRDIPLLNVAEKARVARIETAWSAT